MMICLNNFSEFKMLQFSDLLKEGRGVSDVTHDLSLLDDVDVRNKLRMILAVNVFAADERLDQLLVERDRALYELGGVTPP